MSPFGDVRFPKGKLQSGRSMTVEENFAQERDSQIFKGHHSCGTIALSQILRVCITSLTSINPHTYSFSKIDVTNFIDNKTGTVEMWKNQSKVREQLKG